ncbi:hypothetical protein [Roseibium sp. SCP14]|uniref:hypothetical protein n=1 Tax=Roseibium sp. SCP14 TaxID=3141375 RepID=UPI00333A3F20
MNNGLKSGSGENPGSSSDCGAENSSGATERKSSASDDLRATRELGKKYCLTDESKRTPGGTLYRIKALRAFGNVAAGEVGGFVESENNLSQDGLAWISDNAEVSGKAWVSGDALVSDMATVSGKAKVSDEARISGRAAISGRADIRDQAQVRDQASVHGLTRIWDKACISENAFLSDAVVADHAQVHGDAHLAQVSVTGNARIFGDIEIFAKLSFPYDAALSCDRFYLVIQPIGCHDAILSAVKSDDGRLWCTYNIPFSAENCPEEFEELVHEEICLYKNCASHLDGICARTREGFSGDLDGFENHLETALRDYEDYEAMRAAIALFRAKLKQERD